MAYTNPRSLSLANIGPGLRTVHTFTKTAYTSAGTSEAAVGDVVTNNTAANWGIEIAPDNDVSFLGKVVKIEKAAGSGTGYAVVEWYDIVRFVELTTDDLSTVTLGNSAIKDGATTVLDNFDAGATTGNLIVVSKSGTSGAGTIVAALRAA